MSAPINNNFNPPMHAQQAFGQMFNNIGYDARPDMLIHSNHNYGQFSTGGSLHDTFRIDTYNNIYNGHTTLDLGAGKKIHLDW